MATKKKSTTKEKPVRIPKISWVVKPDGMTLKDWQRALRKQIAREETMAVSAVCPGSCSFTLFCCASAPNDTRVSRRLQMMFLFIVRL